MTLARVLGWLTSWLRLRLWTTAPAQLGERGRAPLRDLAVMLAAARPPADEAARLGRELEAARTACRDREYEAGLFRQIRIARDIGWLDGRRLASAQ